MHTPILQFALILFIFVPARAQEWFGESRAWLDFRHNFYLSPGSNYLLRDLLVGDFSFNGETAVASGSNWSVILTLKMHNIYGGFKDRRVKIYAINYIVELAWRKRLWRSGPLFFLSSFHQSTHLADPLPLKTFQDFAAFRELNISIADLNLLRFGFVEENGDDVWQAIIQPIRLNYFLFAEPKYVFEENSYQSYEKRLYLSGFKTLWRDDTYRLGAGFEGELEGGAQYVVQIRLSARLAERPEWDKVQIFIAYEGGLAGNHIRATPYSGLSAERAMLGGRLFF